MKTFFEKNGIEFFRKADGFEVFFIKDLSVRPFLDLSMEDAEMLRKDLDKYPAKLKAMEKAGIHDPIRQLEIYAGCVFGAFDAEPDFVCGRRTGFEFTPCNLRGSGECPLGEIICDKGKFIMKERVLTRRQVEILSKIREDTSEVEMAQRLFISVNTAKRHMQNLRDELQARSKVGLALFAQRHNL